MWQVLCPFYIPTHIHTRIYVVFWLCPFFTTSCITKHLHSPTLGHTYNRSSERRGADCCCCSARIKCISIASSHTIFVFVFTSMHSLTLFVSALNLVNYCCSSVPIRDEQFLNTIFVDSLCLQFSHTHTHTHAFSCRCCLACVCERAKGTACVCVFATFSCERASPFSYLSFILSSFNCKPHCRLLSAPLAAVRHVPIVPQQIYSTFDFCFVLSTHICVYVCVALNFF